MKAFISLLVLFLSFTISLAQRPTTMAGTVIEVLTGDVMIVNAAHDTKFTVRLRYVDAPEKSQELYQTSRDHLSGLVLNKDILFDVKAMSANIISSKVLLNGVDIGMQMLRDGAAFYDSPGGAYQDADERQFYISNETLAKNEKRGVWSMKDITPVYQLRAEREKREKERMDREWAAYLKLAVGMARYKGPAIGMHFYAFKELCNAGAEGGDYISISEGGDSLDMSASLTQTKNRTENSCWGDFTFIDFRLVRMSKKTRDQ